MANDLNKVQLIGRLGRDPEVRALTNGKRVANLSLATGNSWKDRSTGEKRERTEWHRIVIWNDGLLGVVERYCVKGDQLYIEGELQTRKWKDNSGNDRYSTEVVLQGFGGTIQMLGGSGGGGSRGESRDQGSGQTDHMSGDAPDELDDEIPF